MTTSTEEKRAANEAARRDANEEIRAGERRIQPALDRVPYLCGCVRADGATFAIDSGSLGGGGVARSLDPREEQG